MEKKTVKVQTYKQVKSGFTEKEIFVSKDGKEFSTAAQCKKYEDEVARCEAYDNIRKISDNDLADLGSTTWFFCTTEEEVDLVYETYDHYVYFHGKEKMQLNRWFGMRYEDGGDHRGDIYVYDLETIQKEVEEFFRKFKE